MADQQLPAGFERVACNYCGSADAAFYAELQDWLCGLPGRFTLVRCARCGLIRQNPRPNPATIGGYYPAEYKPFADAQEISASLRNRLTAWSLEVGLRRRVRTVTRHVPAGRLLDVGCATGLFLDAARRYGDWQVQGIEPSASAAEFGRQQLGLDIHQGTLADAPVDDASFDVITMWDVLEHLHDPVDAIQRVAAMLRPGGMFIIRVPHLESLDARLFGRYWAGLDAPRHLYLFPRPLLTEMLSRAGLTVLERRCWGGYHIFALSLQFWLRSRQSVVKTELPWRRFLLSPAVRLISFPWFYLIDRGLGRGSALMIAALKRATRP